MPEILIFFAVTVFLEQVSEGTPEIGVTTLLDCSIQRNRRAVMVRTLDRRTTGTGTGIEGVRRDSTLLETNERLYGLERGTRRVHRLCSTVHERFGGIFQEGVVVLAAVFADQHFGVPTGVRDQSQDLACFRFDSYGATDLTCQQFLCE